MRIVIDGNDGTGKSTIVSRLRGMGFQVQDRGWPTKMTEGEFARPEGEVCVILDAPEELCHKRIADAGKDVTERYHTMEDLRDYRKRFLDVGRNGFVPVVDSSGDESATLEKVLAALGLPNRDLRIGLPKGRDLDKLNLGSVVVDISNTYLLRPRSIPQMVALGLLEVGIVGQDLLKECGYEDEFQVIATCLSRQVRIVVGAKKGTGDILLDPYRRPRRPLVVATEYPSIVDKWLTGLGLAHVCIQSGGSTEAWVSEWADLCVDVVDTGKSFQDFGLIELRTLMTSRPVLIAKKKAADAIRCHAFVRIVENKWGELS